MQFVDESQLQTWDTLTLGMQLERALGDAGALYTLGTDIVLKLPSGQLRKLTIDQALGLCNVLASRIAEAMHYQTCQCEKRAI